MAIKISAIAAMAENRVIGKDGGMCWHVPGDLKHFKQTTMGKPLVMGRKSYESLGKPLPGRANIVVSRSMKDLPRAGAPTEIHNTMESVARDLAPHAQTELLLFADLTQAIEEAKKIAARDGVDEIFIAGGGEIYKAALPVTERIYLTVIHRDYDGDAFFPELDMKEWREISAQRAEGDPAYTVKVLERA